MDLKGTLSRRMITKRISAKRRDNWPSTARFGCIEEFRLFELEPQIELAFNDHWDDEG
jgi:hypothetical protein